jgi:uncharacterized membrane protein YhaH (DUF805 family)
MAGYVPQTIGINKFLNGRQDIILLSPLAKTLPDILITVPRTKDVQTTTMGCVVQTTTIVQQQIDFQSILPDFELLPRHPIRLKGD